MAIAAGNQALASDVLAIACAKQFFVPVSSYGSGGSYGMGAGSYHVGYKLDASAYTYFSFRVPNNFTTLTSAKMVLVSEGTGTFDWTITTYFGANGEAYNANTDTTTADGQAVTSRQMLELDVSAAFTALAANDIVAAVFQTDALATATEILAIGIDIKYS